MKEEHLLEFLRSTIEGDAIISRVYKLFHIEFQYPIQVLNNIIETGLRKKIFRIEDVDNQNKQYTHIEWKRDNAYQEVIMNEDEKYIKDLFSKNAKIPRDFLSFLKKK